MIISRIKVATKTLTIRIVTGDNVPKMSEACDQIDVANPSGRTNVEVAYAVFIKKFMF